MCSQSAAIGSPVDLPPEKGPIAGTHDGIFSCVRARLTWYFRPPPSPSPTALAPSASPSTPLAPLSAAPAPAPPLPTPPLATPTALLPPASRAPVPRTPPPPPRAAPAPLPALLLFLLPVLARSLPSRVPPSPVSWVLPLCSKRFIQIFARSRLTYDFFYVDNTLIHDGKAVWMLWGSKRVDIRDVLFWHYGIFCIALWSLFWLRMQETQYNFV
jgi:hypothetical protein